MSYSIVNSLEPPMSWNDYEQTVLHEWSSLLESSQSSPDERSFQSFFERHPCMLPCGIEGGHHGVFPLALISQPPLSGLGGKIPDFLWIVRDSASVYAVLVEIEEPSKPWATESGQQNAKLTQAINQIKDWKSWFKNPTNETRFIEDYRIPQFLTRKRSFEQRYILVYGRRSDPTLTEKFNKKRIELQGENEIYMTYDRLFPNQYYDQNLTVKLDDEGYKAISVPPTIKLSPSNAKDRSLIRDKEIAIRKNNYLSTPRKEFLINRLEYWDNWARDCSKPVPVSIGDWE